MAATRIKLVITYDDGDREERVTADQRDLAAFEGAKHVGWANAMDTMMFIAFRWVGWHALRRTGAIDVGLAQEKWDAGVVSVDPDDEEVPADPTQPAASGETS